ncbi:MAG: hypothetical protein K0R57_1985 [Paenibacillaceae bacterium]|jgi:YesN/AraC family two-component response regulator|nr:hypothetical protein [Paenibacillaceae bacterium]
MEPERVGPMKVLLVDDEWIVTEGISRMLDWEALGFDEILSAQDGMEAWECFMEHKPDLVLTDISMPGLNGIEFIKRIREQGFRTPVIILSGYDEFDYAKEAIDLQVVHYLLKPAVVSEIEAAVKEVVHKLGQETSHLRFEEKFLREVRQNISMLRGQFLHDVVMLGKPAGEFDQERLDFYGVADKVLHGGLLLLLKPVRLNHHKVSRERDWQLFRFSLHNITEELLSGMSEGAGYTLPYREAYLPVLLTGSRENALAAARQLAEAVIANAEHFLELPVSAAIGSWYPASLNYWLSYKEAFELLQRMEDEGAARILYAMEEERKPDYRLDRTFQWIRSLAESILMKEVQELKRSWSQIREFIIGEDLSREDLRAVCSALVSRVMIEVYENNRSLLLKEQAASGLDPMDVFVLIQKHQTRRELLQATSDFMEQLIGSIEGQMDGRGSNPYIDRVIEHIREHYREQVTLEELSRSMHLSRTYLSNLFKKVTGQSFIQYLTAYRLDKAIVLLYTKKYMISEIAELVGYPDPSYFSKVFKAATGHSPAEYIVIYG